MPNIAEAEEKLKDCPICGGQITIYDSLELVLPYHPRCHRDCIQWRRWFETLDELIEAVNRRA